MGELIFMGIVMVISVIMFIMTYSFPASIVDRSGGAGLFPRIVIILLVFLLVIRTVQIIRKKELHKKFAFFEIFKGNRLVYFLATLICIIAIKYVGYIITISAYLLFSIIYFYKRETGSAMSKKKLVLVVIINVILVVGLYWFFTDVLNILLPSGILRS